jgi:hypothetical protein
MGTLANVDPAAFHKIYRNSENRFLPRDNVIALIEGLAADGQIDGLDGDIGKGEAGLWLLALQVAAAADAQIALLRRRNPSASEAALGVARAQIVKAMRAVWLETGGAAPFLRSAVRRKRTRPHTEEEKRRLWEGLKESMLRSA